MCIFVPAPGSLSTQIVPPCASITSFTMRCVSRHVDVAGFTKHGTPERMATAAFSHMPHDGKLKALIWMPTPCSGTHRCIA